MPDIFLPIFKKFGFSPQNFVVAPNIKYNRNRSTGGPRRNIRTDEQTNGRTDRQTKFITKVVGSFSEHTEKWKVFMEDTSVLSSCLSVYLWRGTIAQAVKLLKSVDFLLKLVDNFDLHLNCPVPNCTVPKGNKEQTSCKKTPLRNVCIAFCRTQQLTIGTPLALLKPSECQRK